jgi:hypothetical protein
MVVFFSLTVIYGCGGGGGGGTNTVTSVSTEGNEEETNEETPVEVAWKATKVKQLQTGGLLSLHVRALQDTNGDVHVTYFTESQTSSGTYDINYLVWNRDGVVTSGDSRAGIIGSIDNCRNLGLALDQDNYPVVSYQGGTIRECGSEQQSDAMISIKEDVDWEEYTGAIGEVERNPVFRDGLAGMDTSLAFDSNGDVHIAYQFLYEGCDSMNFQYPDLYYVKKDRNSLGEAGTVEDQVEGNQYGGTNIQNDVGDHATIVIDSQDNPVIFYYAELSDNTKGLRVARQQQDGTWQKQWIEAGCEVGGISAGIDDGGGLGVAYYVTTYTDGSEDEHLLKYAREQSSSWSVQVVDDTTLSGRYPSLAFDTSGYPAIAYYEMETYSGYELKNLKLARFDGTSWTDREVVASTGDVGLYNSLWFDDSGYPMICSYTNTEDSIYIFYQE